MYASLPYIVIFALLGFVVIHAYMSMRYGYDWIGNSARKMIRRMNPNAMTSVTDLYNIPKMPYMDRFGEFTNVPKKKENVY
jgi:hypothetical protein